MQPYNRETSPLSMLSMDTGFHDQSPRVQQEEQMPQPTQVTSSSRPVDTPFQPMLSPPFGLLHSHPNAQLAPLPYQMPVNPSSRPVDRPFQPMLSPPFGLLHSHPNAQLAPLPYQMPVNPSTRPVDRPFQPMLSPPFGLLHSHPNAQLAPLPYQMPVNPSYRPVDRLFQPMLSPPFGLLHSHPNAQLAPLPYQMPGNLDFGRPSVQMPHQLSVPLVSPQLANESMLSASVGRPIGCTESVQNQMQSPGIWRPYSQQPPETSQPGSQPLPRAPVAELLPSTCGTKVEKESYGGPKSQNSYQVPTSQDLGTSETESTDLHEVLRDDDDDVTQLHDLNQWPPLSPTLRGRHSPDSANIWDPLSSDSKSVSSLPSPSTKPVSRRKLKRGSQSRKKTQVVDLTLDGNPYMVLPLEEAREDLGPEYTGTYTWTPKNKRKKSRALPESPISVLSSGLSSLEVTPTKIKTEQEEKLSPFHGSPKVKKTLFGASVSPPLHQSDIEENSDIDDQALRIGTKRIEFLHPEHWRDVELQEVESLPYDIDGHVKYKLPCQGGELMASSLDGRPWGYYRSSIRKSFKGLRRQRTCNGTHLCQNVHCKFLQLYNKMNKVQFAVIRGTTVCKICREPAEKIACPARKIYEFPFGHKSKYAIIYHNGTHTCEAVPKVKPPDDYMELISKTGKQSGRARVSSIVSLIDTEQPMEKIEEAASKLVDRDSLSQAKRKVKENMPMGHSFDAVVKLKSYSDKLDNFYIFALNNSKMNNGTPTYVFKTCKAALAIAMDMDMDEDGILNEEFCFFDGTHKRCQHFKTLTLWVYHPILQKLLRLATCEVESESSDSITLFWKEWNRALAQYSKIEGYKFNPRGWVVDEAGGNWSGLRNVYGSEAIKRVKSCEFHYKECRNRHRNKLSDEEEKEMFTTLTDHLLYTQSTANYNCALEKVLQFLHHKKHRLILKSWVDWWHKRRHHIFRSWRDPSGPATNLAEVGHSLWAKKGSTNLTLVKAAKEDIAECILLGKEIDSFGKGVQSGGQGPDIESRSLASYKQQMKSAEECGANLRTETVSTAAAVVVDERASHRADRALGGKQKEKRAGSFRSQRSKAFLRTLQIGSKLSLTLQNISEHSDTSHEFTLINHSRGTEYVVAISSHPTCISSGVPCQYTRGGKEICSHIVHVYLKVLGLDIDDTRLQQTALTKCEVREMLKNKKKTCTVSNPHTRSTYDPAQTVVATTTKGRATSIGALPQTTPSGAAATSSGAPSGHFAVYNYTRGKRAKCSGCKKEIADGTLVVEMSGHYSPRTQHQDETFKVPTKFRYCPKVKCMTKAPNRSDVSMPPQRLTLSKDLELSPTDVEQLASIPIKIIMV